MEVLLGAAILLVGIFIGFGLARYDSTIDD